MNRRVPPSFFFNESDADEDLMAEKDAEKTGLDPDALWDAQCAYTDVYDGPGSEEAAMAAAIKAYLASYIREDATP